MGAGFSVLSLFLAILSGLLPIGVLVFIIVIAIKGVKGKGGKVNDDKNNETGSKQSSEDIKASAEEINQKIKNIFANLAAQNNSAQQTKNNEAKSEVKESRCKNCGAALEEDKNGKLHCPYCQSKYF